MTPSGFQIRPDYAWQIRWSNRGSCGESGCKDPECGCALCGLPIGVSDEDPRRISHDEESCLDPKCDLCVDRVPLILFRGEGKHTQQAQFHDACWRKMIAW